jgi:hypothetical protein
LMKWRTSTRSARLSTVSLDYNLDEYLRRRNKASVVPKVAYCIPKVAYCTVLSQAHGVRAAPSRKWRTSTRSARLSTVSLDPILDEYLRSRHQASVVPKVAYCTERVALKVGSQALSVPAAPSINWRTSTRSARLSTVSFDYNLDEYLRRRRHASEVPKVAYSTDRVALKAGS